jgi:cell division protein FtsL
MALLLLLFSKCFVHNIDVLLTLLLTFSARAHARWRHKVFQLLLERNTERSRAQEATQRLGRLQEESAKVCEICRIEPHLQACGRPHIS